MSWVKLVTVLLVSSIRGTCKIQRTRQMIKLVRYIAI